LRKLSGVFNNSIKILAMTIKLKPWIILAACFALGALVVQYVSTLFHYPEPRPMMIINTIWLVGGVLAVGLMQPTKRHIYLAFSILFLWLAWGWADFALTAHYWHVNNITLWFGDNNPPLGDWFPFSYYFQYDAWNIFHSTALWTTISFCIAAPLLRIWDRYWRDTRDEKGKWLISPIRVWNLRAGISFGLLFVGWLVFWFIVRDPSCPRDVAVCYGPPIFLFGVNISYLGVASYLWENVGNGILWFAIFITIAEGIIWGISRRRNKRLVISSAPVTKAEASHSQNSNNRKIN
jgi:hypothetical protein